MKHTDWRDNALALIRNHLAEANVGGIILSSLTDVRYVSGFTGSNALAFITSKNRYLVTDVRYELQAPEEAPGWEIIISRESSLIETLADQRLTDGYEVLGYDERNLTVAQHRNLRSVLKPTSLKRTGTILPELRAVKHAWEISQIRKAARLADKVFAEVAERIEPGLREREIAAELSYRAALAGSEADPFAPIVVSGPRSALIHGKPSDRKLRRGDLVIMDFGCTINGYCSDMTRTIAVGGLSAEKRRMYQTVQDVQQQTIEHARPGIAARSLDTFARAGISNAGYGSYFTHALGHGLGLDVHEDPKVSVKSSGLLKPGNVITIEPGIYVPNMGGVRIEDDIVITERGTDVLTRTPKELLII